MTGTSRSRTGRVRVLIVDDEPTLSEVLSVAVTDAYDSVRVLGDLVPTEDGREARRARTAVQGPAPMIHTGPAEERR